jgi:hypothetical protein
VKDPDIPRAPADVAEDSVVRPDEEMAVGLRDDRSALGADARINDRDVDCPRGERRVGGEQREGGGLNVVRRNVVREVYDLCPRVD